MVVVSEISVEINVCDASSTYPFMRGYISGLQSTFKAARVAADENTVHVHVTRLPSV